jgi:hypothetical protein
MTSRHTRAAIVAACRRMMQAGRLRPTMRACCARAGWSRTTGHRAFGPVAPLATLPPAAELRLALEILDGQGQGPDR